MMVFAGTLMHVAVLGAAPARELTERCAMHDRKSDEWPQVVVVRCTLYVL